MELVACGQCSSPPKSVNNEQERTFLDLEAVRQYAARMGVLEVVQQVAPYAVSLLTLALQGYGDFKKSKVEEFFGQLLANPAKANAVLTAIDKREDLKWLFYSIIDRVASEERKEKIRHWKNLLVSLTTDLSEDEFKDTYTATLDNLSVLDLVVLHAAYSEQPKGMPVRGVEEWAMRLLAQKGIERPLVAPSMNRLIANGLIDEQYVGTPMGSPGEPPHVQNEFGRKFLRMISDDEIK